MYASLDIEGREMDERTTVQDNGEQKPETWWVMRRVTTSQSCGPPLCAFANVRFVVKTLL